MEKAERSVAAVTGGFLLSVFEFFYGSGQVVILAMTALAFFIVMDWITGSRAAHKDESYESKYGLDGVFRTFFMLLLPAGGHLLDKLISLTIESQGFSFGFPPIFFGLFVAGLLYHTIKSMTANAIRAGWGTWIPTWILEKLTNWVRVEIEAKIDRALKRKSAKGEVE